ncbi:MAG: NUDIX domain-containing protein [Spirochaetia bacterium]|nr:NUDIX domain-containing protein [Spirochaetia bacterium]
MRRRFRFCPQCGRPLRDDKTHGLKVKYCTPCNRHYFDNPVPGVGVIAVRDGKILLVKRKLPPMAGTWALPGGFMDQGESIENAGRRELLEETGLRADRAKFFDALSMGSYMFGTVVVLAVEASGLHGKLTAADDAADARFFDLKKMPFIAFSGHVKFIRKYLKQLKSN